METTLDIKKRIHTFIDHADERMLRIINAIITNEEFEEEGKSIVPESFYDEIDERKMRHLRGESKSYDWEEVKDRTRGAIK
ncbi:hypothetical protein [Kaistella jeonii]|uniref:Addiction module protein n=1 Tax=Kaistella jeonii TaxID=266749 RepID=A0A0C1FNA2_9FLAO|nr:hypothetical protein [Kaistella jeonii]KIA89414.1 hypothetical protein OA86_07470 [Kaistella jeonii]